MTKAKEVFDGRAIALRGLCQKFVDEIDTLGEEARESLAGYDSFVVRNESQLDGGAEALRDCKAISKRADEARKQLTRPIDDLKKLIMRFVNESVLDTCTTAERTIKKAIRVWHAERERERLELQRQAEAAAQRKADEERKRLAAEAMRAAKAKDIEEAKAIIAEAEAVQAEPVQVKIEKHKTEGVHMRDNWTAEIIDELQVPRRFLMIDKVKLNQFAKLSKGSEEVPGVRFVNNKIVSARAS